MSRPAQTARIALAGFVQGGDSPAPSRGEVAAFEQGGDHLPLRANLPVAGMIDHPGQAGLTLLPQVSAEAAPRAQVSQTFGGPLRGLAPVGWASSRDRSRFRRRASAAWPCGAAADRLRPDGRQSGKGADGRSADSCFPGGEPRAQKIRLAAGYNHLRADFALCAARILSCAAPGLMPLGPAATRPFLHFAPGLRLQVVTRPFSATAQAGAKTGQHHRHTERTSCSTD